MAHGTPDFGLTAGQKTVYQLTDLGELAARLGSLVTFDRRGDVVALEDFENGLPPWIISLVGAGSYGTLSMRYRDSGHCGVYLYVSAVAGSSAGIYRAYALPASSKIGVECKFSFGIGLQYLKLTGGFSDGTTSYATGLRWNHPATTLQVMKEDKSYVTVASGDRLAFGLDAFNTIKLVFDLETGKYVRAVLNGNTYLLDDYSGYSEAVDENASATLYFGAENSGSLSTTACVDSVILTQNEP